MTKLCSLLIAAGAVSVAGNAYANSFLLNEFDAKAVGRGNATTATDVDPSSIYYNVGGIASADGTNLMIGASLIAPSASFTDSTGTKTDSTTGPQAVPGVFVTSRIHDMVAVGIGFYTPFGLAISWPSSSPQANVLESQSLRTYFITPAAGVNLGSFVPGLTVGAGLDLVPATVELQQAEFFGTDTGSAHLGGTAFGVGGRLGAMYKPAGFPRLSIGAMWRSDVKLDFSGQGDFQAPAEYRPQLPPDGDISTSITLPQQVVGGAAYRPIDALEIEANVGWTNWSKFHELAIVVPSASDPGKTMTTVQAEDYKNTTTLRLGAQYAFPLIGLSVRAGYVYDPTPIPTTTLTAQLPDINRNELTVGASYAIGRYAVHGGLLWVLPGTRAASSTPYMPDFKATYDVSGVVASVTLQARLN